MKRNGKAEELLEDFVGIHGKKTDCCLYRINISSERSEIYTRSYRFHFLFKESKYKF